MSVINDFTELHEAIETELKKRVPILSTVALYDPTDIAPGGSFTIKTPAVLIELTEVKPGRAVTGGRIPFKCEFALHCILSTKSPDLPLAVRNLAAAVAMVVGYLPEDAQSEFVRTGRQSWGLSERGVECVPVDSINIYPGSFKPKGGNEKAIGFDSMIVTFEQQIHFGPLVIDSPAFLPDEIEIGGQYEVGGSQWS